MRLNYGYLSFRARNLYVTVMFLGDLGRLHTGVLCSGTRIQALPMPCTPVLLPYDKRAEYEEFPFHVECNNRHHPRHSKPLFSM